jgi:DNA-binding ferritin-like protein
MNFDYNDLLLEADGEAKEEEKKDEEKKEDEKEDKKEEEKKDEDKKDEDNSNDDEYNDLMDDDIDSDVDTSDLDTDTDDDYNDLMDDDTDDISSDEDPVADDSTSDGGDYNTLIVVKGEDDGGLGGVFEKVAKIGYVYTVISNNMKHIHLNACGKKFEEIHRTAETYYNHFNYFADSMFELASESPLIKLDNPTRAKEHAEGIEVETDTSYTFETAMARMSDNLNKAIECVKDARAAAGDSRTDIQSKLDEELSYLNKEFNYFLRKKMVADDIAATPIAPSDDDIAMESYNWLI